MPAKQFFIIKAKILQPVLAGRGTDIRYPGDRPGGLTFFPKFWQNFCFAQMT